LLGKSNNDYRGRPIKGKLIVISIVFVVLCAPTFGQTTANTWNNKGIGLYFQGKYDEAFKAFDEAIKLDKNDSDAWYNKGIAFVFQGKFEAASISWEEALKLNPEYPEVWYQKGLTLEKQGITIEAVKCYDKAIEIDPNYVEAWNSKISALKKSGRYDEADAAYYKYRYDHKGWNLKDNLAWISCGFGIRWWHTVLSGVGVLIFFTFLYFGLSWHKGLNKVGLKNLSQSFWFSLIVLLSAPKELYPLKTEFYDNYSEHIKYWPVIERIIGWGLLILLINTLSRVMIRY
jgi:tetratricopeptide (TPR) repeat protein